MDGCDVELFRLVSGWVQLIGLATSCSVVRVFVLLFPFILLLEDWCVLLILLLPVPILLRIGWSLRRGGRSLSALFPV